MLSDNLTPKNKHLSLKKQYLSNFLPVKKSTKTSQTVALGPCSIAQTRLENTKKLTKSARTCSLLITAQMFSQLW
jgi:hypothetical protein